MTETSLFLIMIVVLTIGLVVVIARPAPRRGPLVAQTEALVRWAAVAAIAALSTALMYLTEASSQSHLALAVGDGLMVLAGWSVWAALSAVNGRRAAVPLVAIAAAALATVVSLVIAETEATAFKLVLVGLGCLGLGVESLLGRVRASGVFGFFTGVGFGFGGYTLARVGVIAFLGTESLVYKRAFTTLASSLISVLAIVAVSAGVVLLVSRLSSRDTTTTTLAAATAVGLQVLSRGLDLSVYRIEVTDLDLIRRARGSATAHALQDALVAAACIRFPSGILALSPADGGLVVLDAERRGAPSAALDLVAGFDRAVARTGNADLAEVGVERWTVRTPDQLRDAVAPRQVEAVGRRW